MDDGGGFKKAGVLPTLTEAVPPDGEGTIAPMFLRTNQQEETTAYIQAGPV